jgi:hypothetical protein
LEKPIVKKKLIIFLSMALIFVLLYTYDYIRAQTFSIIVESISPQPAPADGQSPVNITVVLKDKNGEPVEGHTLYAYSLNGGVFKSNREITNSEGKAEYIYFPYRVSLLMELTDAHIRVIDESNSIFVEINAQENFEIILMKSSETESESSQHDIFGEDG